MISNLLVPVFVIFSAGSDLALALDGQIDEVVWTQVAESSLLTQEEHKVAFRDVVMEGVVRRAFHVLMESSKRGFKKTTFPAQLLLKDPVSIDQDIAFKKKEAGLVDIDFKAWDLMISGLHSMWIKNLHVLRHIGLKDIRVVVQLITDLSFTGNYSLEGTGLSMIPVTGSGHLSVSVSQLMLTGETFLIVREDEETGKTVLHIKEMDIKMTNQDLDVKLENLLGGGFVGNMANDVLRLVGDDLLYNHKDLLAAEVKRVYKRELSKFLDDPADTIWATLSGS